MNRSVAFGLGLIFAALCWPIFMMLGVLARGWRIVKVEVLDEDELRKAGL